MSAVAAMLSSSISTLRALERLDLESVIYVFKQSSFHEIDITNAVVTHEGHTFILKSPASVRFDRQTLSLEDSRIAWSNDGSAPEQFSLVASPPTVPIALDSPVTITSSVGVEYIERTTDNGLQVREIKADSLDAPHIRLSFTASQVGDSARDLLLDCDLDVATVNARAKVPGVGLEVGKPSVISFKEKEQLHLRSGQRAALILKSPNGSDYSMLLLLKLAYSEPGNVVPSAPGGPSRIAGTQEGRGAGETPVVPVVKIDGKEYVVVGFRDNILKGGGFATTDPIAIVDGKTVVARDPDTKVSIMPGRRFAKGFVAVVDNVERIFLYRPDMLTTADSGFTFGPGGSDLTGHRGYINFSGTLTSERDLADVTMVLVFYEDRNKDDPKIPSIWIVGTSIERLEAGKAYAFNEFTPVVPYSDVPIHWTTLVFCKGWQIPSTGGNQVIDELLDRVRRAAK